MGSLDKITDTLMKMFSASDNSLSFLWDCTANNVEFFSRGFELSDCSPFDSMSSCGMVAPDSESIFAVFKSQLIVGISEGIDVETLSIELSIRLPWKTEYRMCHLFTFFCRDENNKITDILVHIREYDAKELFNSEIIKFFSSDKNPKIFQKSIKDLMNRTDEGDFAFIQFDVERFKLINDTFGVQRGDMLLNFLSSTLDIICTEDQPHCRLTADVFMVVIACTSRDEIIEFIRMLESRLSCFMEMEYKLVFGVCVVGNNADPDDTRRYGDSATIARSSIKGNALTNIAFFEGDMISNLHKRQIIEDDMYKAVVNNEFVMFLQPKYCISSNKLIGAEALARWQHPIRGLISPGEFIPVFEKNGFIVKLDHIIWESACRAVRRWIDAGITPVPISVNVSRAYLKNYDAVEELSRLVKFYDIPIQYLELEITESLDANVDDIIRRFKEAGFTMLMDDFGSGYSSLNMLKTTQFDVLKIDRYFLSEFMESDRGRKIISHTINMSRDIGLNVIAEGVETKAQAEFLNSAGCDAAQGFYYSKPVPTDVFDELLLNSQK